MKKIILIGFAIAMVTEFLVGQEKDNNAAELSLDTTGQVQVEEYVPKVIVKGEWGTGPGEFGELSGAESWEPEGLVVDSDRNIYILDTYNNRIQKFDKTGQLLKVIPVLTYRKLTEQEEEEKRKKYREETEKQGKKFFMNPYDVEFGPAVLIKELWIDSENNLYVPQGKIANKYNKEGKIIEKVEETRWKELKKKIKENIKIDENNKIQKQIPVELGKKSKYGGGVKKDKKNNIYVFIPMGGYICKYNINGKFLSKVTLQQSYRYGYYSKEEPFIDDDGNIYQLVSEDYRKVKVKGRTYDEAAKMSGLKVIKWELKKKTR